MIGALLVIASALAIDMNPADFQPVTFGKIPPTVYERSGDSLKMTVVKSSSFLLKPFEAERAVSSVSFEWQSQGELHVKDAAAEKTKEGDDGHLKICLMISGKAPLVPFFASAWVKAVRDAMKLPADRLRCLIVGTKAKVGEKWPSPYDDSIELVAVDGPDEGKGWRRADAKFDQPLRIVGVWIMADGDDTGSEFTTRLRDLTLR